MKRETRLDGPTRVVTDILQKNSFNPGVGPGFLTLEIDNLLQLASEKDRPRQQKGRGQAILMVQVVPYPLTYPNPALTQGMPIPAR